MNGTSSPLQSAIAEITTIVADYYKGLARIDREFDAARDRIDQSIYRLNKDLIDQEKKTENVQQQANAKQEQRIGNWKSSFADNWKKTTVEIEKASSKLRHEQPSFIDFGKDIPLAATEVPTSLLLGSQQISFGSFSCLAPHAIPFPFARALILPGNNTAQLRLAHHLMLRLLSAMPPSHLELTLIDPLKLGQSLEPFLPLLKLELLVPQQRAFTRSDEIETALGKLTDEVEELIQHRFKGSASNWAEYNADNSRNPLPYKVIFIFDVPTQLSDKSLWFLERLCENGPRCGILPIIAIDGQRIEDRRYEKFHAALETSAMLLEDLLLAVDVRCDGLSLAYQPEQWPEQGVLDEFISELAVRYAKKTIFSKSLHDLWGNFAEGSTTVGGFDIPIGWTLAGEAVPLTLGATTSEHHVLLAGKTGSGKSNLLHVMIHTLCEKYAPGELDLYLLDYKESTEFTVYANPPLPHARLVATESDPEYGVTVLQHLVDELENRAQAFKTLGVRDFDEYRNLNHGLLPRIFLVIDEFQMLFTEGGTASKEAEDLLSRLLKQGRSFGIHILLATQTLKNIAALSIGALVTQLGCRIALACGQEDSAMILGSGNWAAAELRSPPEGIINTANGAKSGNVKFLIPLAESEFCRDHLAKLSRRAVQRGVAMKTHVFNGANLPILPNSGDFQSLLEQKEVLLLGEQLTFNAGSLFVPLTTRNAFNVLFCGYNDRIHDGLLTSTLFSLVGCSVFDEIIYFNGRGIPPSISFSKMAETLRISFKAFDNIDHLPLQEILDDIGKRRIALIVDGLDSERAFHPAPLYQRPKPGEQTSYADLLKRIADEGTRKGTFVLGFVDNWRRCAGSCKDLFNLFELRIAFCMNEDDAGALVSGGIGKFKGIDKPNRAIFVNRMTNEIVWFRPYMDEDSQ